MKRGNKPKWVRELALKRIKKLFNLAEENKQEHPERARRYVELARKISRKYNVMIPNRFKNKFCKKCNAYFTSKNARIRKVPKIGAVVYVCLECGFKKIVGNKRKNSYPANREKGGNRGDYKRSEGTIKNKRVYKGENA